MLAYLGCGGDCGPVVEQMSPIDSWGRGFLIAPFARLGKVWNVTGPCPDIMRNQEVDIMRILAGQDNTVVKTYVSGQVYGNIAPLAAGRKIDLVLSGLNPVYIEADGPVHIMLNMQSWSTRSDRMGDPSMAGKLLRFPSNKKSRCYYDAGYSGSDWFTHICCIS